MTLNTDLRFITHPNHYVIDWLQAIEDHGRRRDIYLDIGIQLRRHGVPAKKITRTYYQLADKPIVRLEKLPHFIIKQLKSYKRKVLPTNLAEDEDEYEVVSDNYSCSGNLEENINEPQTNVTGDVNHQRNTSNHSVDNSIFNDNQNKINIKDQPKQKSVIEKSDGKNLIANVDELSKSSTEKIISINNIQSKKSEGSTEVNNEGKLLNVSKETRTPNIPSIKREELIGMHNLKEQIAKNLFKKNIPLPSSSKSTPSMPKAGFTTIPPQSNAKTVEENGQKPLLSVRTNLFNLPLEKPTNHPQENSKKTSNAHYEGKINPSKKLLNEADKKSSKCHNEDIHRLEGNPIPFKKNLLETREKMDEMTAQILNLKQMAESRKRLSESSAKKLETVKKRRFSQPNTITGERSQKQNDQSEDCGGTTTSNKNVSNKEQTQPEPTIQKTPCNNVSTFKSQLQSTIHDVITKQLTQTVSDVGNSSSAGEIFNRAAVSEEHISKTLITESQTETEVNSHFSRSLKLVNVNYRPSMHPVSASQITQKETNEISSNVTMKMVEKSANEPQVNETVSSSEKRPSVTSSVNNPMLSSILTQPDATSPPVTASVNNPLLNSMLTQPDATSPPVTASVNNSLLTSLLTQPDTTAKTSSLSKGNIPLNSQNVLQAPGQDKSKSSQTHQNRRGSEFRSVQLGNQIASQTSQTATQAPHVEFSNSNHSTVNMSEINVIVKTAIDRFLVYFCSQPNNNLSFIPVQVCHSSNQYCIRQRRPQFKTLQEHLKLYFICYIKMFSNEDLRRKIGKIAELLHLSIADFHRKEERKEQAVKLQSEVLRKEEINRADKDYIDILSQRGKQFADIFLSVLPNMCNIKGYEFVTLITLYFKITQALLKIDLENNVFVFRVRDLMKTLLINGMPSLPPSFGSCVGSFFEVNNEDFKSSCAFVKQCLLTLYISGYSEADKANFWKLFNYEPVIPHAEYLMTALGARSQTVTSSRTPNNPVPEQQSLTPQSIPRPDPQQNFAPQIPNNVYQQLDMEISNSSQYVNQLSVQTSLVQQRTQNNHHQVPQTPNLLVRVRPPPQLPPFASLPNQPQHMYQQQSTQRNPPSTYINQTNQSQYQQVNQRVQYITKNSPSAAPLAQINRQNVRIAPRPPPSYPQPPYSGPGPGPRPETNQLWEPTNNATNTTASEENRKKRETLQKIKV